jgi:hypothetical protein
MTPNERKLLCFILALTLVASAVIGLVFGALSNLHVFRSV